MYRIGTCFIIQYNDGFTSQPIYTYGSQQYTCFFRVYTLFFCSFTTITEKHDREIDWSDHFRSISIHCCQLVSHGTTELPTQCDIELFTSWGDAHLNHMYLYVHVHFSFRLNRSVSPHPLALRYTKLMINYILYVCVMCIFIANCGNIHISIIFTWFTQSHQLGDGFTALAGWLVVRRSSSVVGRRFGLLLRCACAYAMTMLSVMR